MEGRKPVIMGHDAAQPLPDARLRIQRRRVCWLGLQHESATRFPNDRLYGSPFLLLSSVLDHQQPLAGIVGQQVPQEWRQLPLAQLGADVIVAPARQRGHRPLDMHFGMVVPRGDLGHVVSQAPLGCQGGRPAHGRLIDKDQLPLLGPVQQPRLPLGHKRRLRLGFGLQVAVAQPAHTKPQRVHHLPPPLSAVLETTAGSDEMADHLGRPHTQVIARLPGTAADRLFALRPFVQGESRGAPRDQLTLQALAPPLVEGMDPAPHRGRVPIQPLRHLGTALALHQQQNAVVPLAQSYIVRPAKGSPYLISCDSGMRNRQQAQALRAQTLRAVISQGLKNRHSFVGSL
jgi:rhodanese-related sulfurtransferase